ncbi:fructosamine kinase family protein [Salmonella enterica subsp. enterica]|nr:fructosamine kinase family protein [Salmonella enterica subsp. enterica]
MVGELRAWPRTGPYIFDPARYWGDRECDSAMPPRIPISHRRFMTAISPFLPLPLDFDRQPIYQLYTRLIGQAVWRSAPLLRKSDAIGCLRYIGIFMPDTALSSGIFQLAIVLPTRKSYSTIIMTRKYRA